MADQKKKRLRLRGIKKTNARTEGDILERSKFLWENPGVLRPKCAGKCFFCPFDKSFSAIAKLDSIKDDPEALVKYANKGGDDIAKAYAATISLYAAGQVPYLATARFPGRDPIAFAQRGTVSNDMLIATQYHDDPRLRLLLYMGTARKKGLHIYAFGDETVCSNKINMPEDYLYDTFWDLPYEFPDDDIQCGHDADAVLVIKIKSLNKEIRICRNCAKEVATLANLFSRMISVDYYADVEVLVEHKYHSAGEDSVVKIPEDIVKKYAAAQITDVGVINYVLKDKISNLKSSGNVTFIIDNKNYGSDMNAFMNDVFGTDDEKLALRKYLEAKPSSVIIKTNRAVEALTFLWSDYSKIIECFTSKVIADKMGDISKTNPGQAIKDAKIEFVSYDVVSKLPTFQRMGVITKYADDYAKAVMVGGADMLATAIENNVPRETKSRSLCRSFVIVANTTSNIKVTKEEEDFAQYLVPFVKQLVESNGNNYRDNMNTLLTALGCGESV